MTRLLAEEDATGRTKEVFGEIRRAFGVVPNFFKAQAAVDPEWLELNWNRVKKIMIDDGALDRKTKELLATAVSLVNHCEYCTWAHERMARAAGANDRELVETMQVVELFASFNAIADSLNVPIDAPGKK